MKDTLRSVVIDKLLKMDHYINELEEAKPACYQDYIRNKILNYGIERLIQLIIDLALDINNIIIKDKDRPPATDYFNSFIDLVEIGVLEHEFAYKIASSTELRNRLIHEYEKIDNKIVYQSIDKTCQFYRDYMKKISTYIGM
ncbi:MAG: DUF86 domain-containing protein [Deferribacterota bacterium]|nr:DUF86 domain-containing protein [Deferribacterota bacterium]